ncbi:translesion DNA synthesis-associated protein ImuA [Chitinimonas naiadis]
MQAVQAALIDVLKHPGIWRGDGFSQARQPITPCGHAALAGVLPGGGWPQAAVSEIIPSRAGCGELRMLLPALAKLTQAGQKVLLIAPPHIPYAPAWQAAGVDMRHLTWIATENEHDAQWAMEQALREPACGAVVGWFKQSLSDRNCRRLQLAAETGGGCGFVLREGKAEALSSPFSLRLAVESVAGGVAVRVLKRRGSPDMRPVFLPHDAPRRSQSGPSYHAVASAVPTQPAPRRPAPQRYAYAA